MTELPTSVTFEPYQEDCQVNVPAHEANLRQHYDYEELKAHNMISVIKPILQAGYAFNMEGKLEPPRRVMATNTPWAFAVQDNNRHCEVWHKIWFGLLNMLPSPCLGCWKVVVRPPSIKDLFKLRDIQVEMGVPSKCGIEIRETVFGNYGGYFYTDSKAQGLMRWAEVRQLVDERIGKDCPVILKRGCTEFEAKFGDSDRWEEHITDETINLENYLLTLMPYENNPHQMDLIKPDVMQRWIEHAYSVGDPDYAEFTRGKPIYAPYVKYHDAHDAYYITRLLRPEDEG